MGSSWSPASAKQPELCEPGLRRAQLRQLLGQRWLLATCNTVSMGERTLIRTLRFRTGRTPRGRRTLWSPTCPSMRDIVPYVKSENGSVGREEAVQKSPGIRRVSNPGKRRLFQVTALPLMGRNPLPKFASRPLQPAPRTHQGLSLDRARERTACALGPELSTLLQPGLGTPRFSHR